MRRTSPRTSVVTACDSSVACKAGAWCAGSGPRNSRVHGHAHPWCTVATKGNVRDGEKNCRDESFYAIDEGNLVAFCLLEPRPKHERHDKDAKTSEKDDGPGIAVRQAHERDVKCHQEGAGACDQQPLPMVGNSVSLDSRANHGAFRTNYQCQQRMIPNRRIRRHTRHPNGSATAAWVR